MIQQDHLGFVFRTVHSGRVSQQFPKATSQDNNTTSQDNNATSIVGHKNADTTY